jgi:hypothetical protein
MRIALFVLLAGCISYTESHGVTAKQYSGKVQMVFTNATPEKLCGLYLSDDKEPDYGDNWLPAGGLATGASLEFRVKPGTYKARWASCKDAHDAPTVSYSACRVHETAIDLEVPTQLFAFVSDGTPPTKRATPRRGLQLVRFGGLSTQITASK